MRFLILFVLVCSSFSANANLCSKFSSGSEDLEVLQSLVSHIKRTLDEVCHSMDILDIEVAPSQVILPSGEIVPQMRVSFHYNYRTCQYFIARETLDLTKYNCYNTW